MVPSVSVSVAAPVPAALVPADIAHAAARPSRGAAIPRAAVNAQQALSQDIPALPALYDGARGLSPAAVAVDGAVAPLGSGLRMARAEHEDWLSMVVALLSGTRTGRRILRDIDRLAVSRGVPILLDVSHISNNGEFRYDSNLLVMDAGHLKRDPYQSAPILAHELQHVLQRAMSLPSDALELEIESYTVESRVWTELGVEPAPGSFARDARKRLRKDLAAFVQWLSVQYSDNIPHYGNAIAAYRARVEKKLEKAKRSEEKMLRKRASVERVLESMRANGLPEKAIAAHRRDELDPLDVNLRDAAVNRGWIERDLRLLDDPVSLERFRAYARGVIRRARSLSRP